MTFYISRGKVARLKRPTRKNYLMTMNKTQFSSGSFAYAERMLWSRRMTKAALGCIFYMRNRDN